MSFPFHLVRYALAGPLLLLCACAAPAHNYAGSPGSVYDKAAQPPTDYSQSDYDRAAAARRQPAP